MVVELQLQQFTIRKLKLELLAVEHWIVLVDDAVVVILTITKYLKKK